MRKGISLLELLMAIVLLGILSSLGFKYYKIYWDTTFAVKQAKMYLIIEEATYLSGAHDLFETKNGIVPASLEDMVEDKQLKEIPQMPEEITGAKGWELYTYQTESLYGNGKDQGNGDDGFAYYDGNVTLDNSPSGPNDIVFSFDLNGSASVKTARQDLVDYCNIINNTGNRKWSLDSNITVIGALGTDYNDTYLNATGADSNISTSFFCFSRSGTANTEDYNLTVAFVKLVDPT